MDVDGGSNGLVLLGIGGAPGLVFPASDRSVGTEASLVAVCRIGGLRPMAMRHGLGSVVWFLAAPLPIGFGVPTALAWWSGAAPSESVLLRTAGLLVLTGATVGLVVCFVDFARRGEGTPAPYAPPGRLVIGRLYRLSRNPMYVAVVAAVLGQAAWWESPLILAYAVGLSVAFHLRVVKVEEPALRRRFGAAYDDYCARVPRWLGFRPRRHPGGGGDA